MTKCMSIMILVSLHKFKSKLNCLERLVTLKAFYNTT